MKLIFDYDFLIFEAASIAEERYITAKHILSEGLELRCGDLTWESGGVFLEDEESHTGGYLYEFDSIEEALADIIAYSTKWKREIM